MARARPGQRHRACRPGCGGLRRRGLRQVGPPRSLAAGHARVPPAPADGPSDHPRVAGRGAQPPGGALPGHGSVRRRRDTLSPRMAGVRIVCDSTADLEADFRAAHDVRVVPLKVIFGDEVFEDGVTIHPSDFYARMRRSTVHPRTSQPTPAEFEAAFRELSEDGSSIACTTISSEMSGSLTSAAQARAALPDRDIRVIDTLSVAVGHNAAVHAAIVAAEAGASAEAVVAAVRMVLDTQKI